MEKLIVRATIFGMAIYLLIIFCFAWNGILIRHFIKVRRIKKQKKSYEEL